MLIGGAGSFVVWVLCRSLPESPRWLARHGHLEDAERVTSVFERHAEAHLGHPLPAPKASTLKHVGKASFAEILRPPYRRRTIMLAIFNFFQAIAFYGFGNWLPALVNAQKNNAPRSAQISFLITLAFPIGPLLWSTIAEKYERKWQIVGAAVGTAIFGMLFATHTASLGLVVLGILITLMNSLLGYCSHAYQAELFPTRMRARAVGFVYSWDVYRPHLPALSLDSSSNVLELQEFLLLSPSLCSWSSSLSEFSGRPPVASHSNRFLISVGFLC